MIVIIVELECPAAFIGLRAWGVIKGGRRLEEKETERTELIYMGRKLSASKGEGTVASNAQEIIH